MRAFPENLKFHRRSAILMTLTLFCLSFQATLTLSSALAEELLPCGLPVGKAVPLNLCGQGPQVKGMTDLGITYCRQPMMARLKVSEISDPQELLQLISRRALGLVPFCSDGKAPSAEALESLGGLWASLAINHALKPPLQSLMDPMWNGRIDTMGWEIQGLFEKGVDSPADVLEYISFLSGELLKGVASERVASLLTQVQGTGSFKVFRGMKVDFFISLDQWGKPMGVSMVFGEKGFSGPVRVLVGLDLQGQVRGVRILEHMENWHGFEIDAWLDTLRGVGGSDGKGGTVEPILPAGEKRPALIQPLTAVTFAVKRALFVFQRFRGTLESM